MSSGDRPRDDEPLFSDETRRSFEQPSPPPPPRTNPYQGMGGPSSSPPPWQGGSSRRDRDPGDDYDDFGRSPPKSNGLAVASLVLGIFSCGCSVLAGIPAIICGAISLSRTSAGKGMAITGIVFGSFSILAIPVLIGMLLPAVQKVREAAARTKDLGTMKMNIVAVHNYASRTRDAFTLPAAVGPVSWRVQILPELEQSKVYTQFDLNERWDSPKNLPLASIPIGEFRAANDPVDSTFTRLRTFTGPETNYPLDGKPGKLVPQDGASNTIFNVYTEETVPWPQPKEILYSATTPLPELSTQYYGVFLVSMLDGSTRTFRKDISEKTLRAAITANGDDKLGPDW